MNTMFKALVDNVIVLIQSEDTEHYYVHRPINDNDEESLSLDCPYDPDGVECGSWCTLFEVNKAEQLPCTLPVAYYVRLACRNKTFKVKDILHLADNE